MLKIAICDDIKNEIAIIQNYITSMNLTIPYEVHCYESGPALLAHFKEKYAYDILILDMRMEPLNGIEVAERIRAIDTELPILIVTSTVDYAVDGYRVNAFRYLVKPINEDEFHDLINQMIDLLKKRNNYMLTFPSKDGLTPLPVKNIYYIESDLRTIRIQTENGEHHFTGKISTLEDKLTPHGFIRVHKSFLVNLSKIKNIYKDTLTLDNDEEIPLSKHKKKEVSERFLEFMEINL